MKNLKDRLSEKLDIIESIKDSNIIAEDNCPGIDKNDNLIILKGHEEVKALSTVPEFEITLKEAKDRLVMLQNFVKEIMIPGVDYGVIPKCDKPTLFKSGGEKLCDIFGFSKQFEIINRVEEWEKGIFHYEVMATLINKRTGLIEAQGIGCCNNKERKYASQDAYSLINTILKMSKKRAFIDAVLSATRSSGIFTQDIEDDETANSKNVGSKRNTKSPATPSENLVNPINQKQLNDIISIVNQKRIPTNKMKSIIQERYKIPDSKQLNEYQANDLINYLKAM